jgi:hypothetical protein
VAGPSIADGLLCRELGMRWRENCESRIVPKPLDGVTECLEGVLNLLPTLRGQRSISHPTDEALMRGKDFLVGCLRGDAQNGI